MGRVVREVLADRGEEVAFAAARHSEELGALDDETEFVELLDRCDPDVVVDFTAPEAAVRYAEACADAGIPLVTGTTGFDEDQQAALRQAGDRTAVLVGANFSRGVQALLSVVAEAAGALPEYDVEVTETHHNGKVDAPSGTAGLLLDRVEAERGAGERVHGREGDQPRNEGEIGVHACRAGDVTGEHEVLLAGNSEVLELTHRAGDRRVFAEGAVDAAAWLAGQPADYYEFSEVAANV